MPAETSTNQKNVSGQWYKDHIYSDQTQVKRYRKVRPDYPEEFFDLICDYLDNIVSDSKKRDLAVDLACGSGQATRPLSRRFDRVIGMDISAAQIEQAQIDADKPANLTYRVGPAEDLHFLQDETVDLITVATAAHWLDLPRFYKEALRVLKKGGVLAIFSYTWIEMDNSRATQAIIKFHTDSPMAPKVWTTGNAESVADLEIPFKETKSVDDLEIREKTNLARAVGLMESWSIYQAYITANPGSQLLHQVQKQIEKFYEEDNGVAPGTPAEELPVTVTYPTTMRLGRK